MGRDSPVKVDCIKQNHMKVLFVCVLTFFSSSLFGPNISIRASASSYESPLRDVLNCSNTSSNGIRS